MSLKQIACSGGGSSFHSYFGSIRRQPAAVTGREKAAEID